MSKAHPPELKKYMDKKVSYNYNTLIYYKSMISCLFISFQIHLKINGGRAVEGVLRGFDPFMNLVLDDALE